METYRKVILFNGEKDVIMDFYNVGEVITPDTEKGKELVNRLRLATGMDKPKAQEYINKLAKDGLVDMELQGVLSTEDGPLYFHLFNEDKGGRLDNHNYTSVAALLEPVREWAKSDHDEEYVDSLSDKLFCRYWYFKLLVTEKPIEGEGLSLDEIRAQQPVGIIYDNHRFAYDLYQDCECIAQFDFLDDATEAYNEAVKQHPDSMIDVLSADGEISYI